MTGLGEALIDVFADSVDQLVTLEALATCLVIPHLTVALATAGQLTGFDAAIRLGIASTIVGTVHMIDALHLEASDSSIIGITQEASGTAARRLMCLRLAKGIRATNCMQTGIRALSMDAAQAVGAVLVLVTLSWLRATLLCVTISNGSLGADTAIGAGHILAPGTGMTRLLRALIDVRATEGSSNESTGTLAFASQAEFCWRAIGIGFTARLAGAIRVADLPSQAIVAGVADLAANLLIATLAHSAGRGLGAGQIALVANAHVSTGTLITRQTGSGYSHAALLGCWVTLEAFGAVALAAMLRNAAQRIGATAGARLTGIQALVADARLVLFAFLVAATADGTVSLQTGQSTGALTVIQAGDNANIAHTSLAIGAILRVATGHTALSVVAQFSSTIHIGQTLGGTASTAILGQFPDGLEA